MQRPELDALPSHERVQLLVKDINDAKVSGAHFSSGPIPAGGGGGTGGGDGGSGSTTPGYARIYQVELRALMNSTTYQNKLQMFRTMRDGIAAAGMVAAVPPAHPFQLIECVLQSREMTLWHALLGYKDKLPGVPEVEWIANNLRAQGPAFFGHALLDSALPPLPPGSPARMPFALTVEWQAVLQGQRAFRPREPGDPARTPPKAGRSAALPTSQRSAAVH